MRLYFGYKPTARNLLFVLANSPFSVMSDSTNPPLAPLLIKTIQQTNLESTIIKDTIAALTIEHSNWATGNTSTDPFYTELPPNATLNTPPGSLLKLELMTNTSLYTLPPDTALSRMIYQTEDLNGTAVPNSAFILWPYQPRIFKKITGIPIVSWAHGTSGVFEPCAPSHYRDLQYQFAAPFTLATQGYVVVAPDYAGLGVSATFDGVPIAHRWAASSSQANDLFYSVQAAQAAFPDLLAKDFVTMGHSQGGGVALASAQRQAVKPVEGHLGTISGSPLTSILIPGESANETLSPEVGQVLSYLAVALEATFPEFQPQDIFTVEGLKRFELLKAVEGCSSVNTALMTGTGVVQEDWTQNPYIQLYQNITTTSDKKVANPLLIIQGLADTTVPALVTDLVVNRTCNSFSDSKIEYWTLPGVTHVPALWATQRLWLDWIADRFDAVAIEPQCDR